MFELTQLEKQLLEDFNNLGFGSIEFWYLDEETRIPTSKLRGVISSLVQKNILRKFKSEGESMIGYVSKEIQEQIKKQL